MKTLDSCRWGITFLRTDSRLSEDDRNDLMDQATLMYLKSETRRKVKTDSYEGIIFTEGKYEMLGMFGGQRFDAKLDTNHGTSKLEFLVTEKINPALN